MTKFKLTLVRSPIGRPEKQRFTVQALGLTKMNKTVIKEDSPQIRGMINVVSHMVEVQE